MVFFPVTLCLLTSLPSPPNNTPAPPNFVGEFPPLEVPMPRWRTDYQEAPRVFELMVEHDKALAKFPKIVEDGEK